MRIIARSTIAEFGARHPETRASLDHWEMVTRAAQWENINDVVGAFSKAKALNGERVRFEIAGGDYSLIVAFKFGTAKIAFIKFVGTHAQYNKIDALAVNNY